MTTSGVTILDDPVQRDQSLPAPINPPLLDIPTPRAPIVSTIPTTVANRTLSTTSNWQNWALVRFTIKGLPLKVTTLQIYNNFKIYGNVTRIAIFETRAGYRSSRAEVAFEPPPAQSFWERSIPFTSNGLSKFVHAEISHDQRSNFTIESPVHKGVRYDEKIQVTGESIEFGVLQTPNRMLTFATRGNKEEKPLLKLDLRSREIVLLFPSVFHSQTRSATRSYRLLIALDDHVQIWQVKDGSYVLHLDRPTWYSKQLREAVAQTHNEDSKIWSMEDTWARQTDIFGHKNDLELINKTPVSLQKEHNTINPARWTTFKFNAAKGSDCEIADHLFTQVLKDFNLAVKDGKHFQFSSMSSIESEWCWNLLNGPTSATPLALHKQMDIVTLPFSVRYQLEVCLSKGWLSEYAITKEFVKALLDQPEHKAKQSLVYVDSFQKRIFDPMVIFQDMRYSKPTRPKMLPEGCVEVYSAIVTASSIIFNTPTVEITNRIVRKYKQLSHRFLRVRFEDDSYRGQTRLYPSSNNKMVLIFQRVKRVLQRGIRLGDIHYEFLAWGNSQLREHGAYFFASTGDVSASRIRAEMGDFQHENVIAKRAARMGQCFSTTKPVNLRLPVVTKLTTIPDIKRGKYNFSDGVGKISELAAKMVSEQLLIKGRTPSLFQFRLGGCKGVLGIAPELRGIDVKVRESQFKFSSLYGELEIIRWSEFWQPYLNRQLILCLSSLGVPNEVFLQKQEETIHALDSAMKEDGAAIKALRGNVDPNLMTLTMSNMVEAGFRQTKEPFMSALLNLWRAWSLKYLKEKAKIPVPLGAFVLATVDETGTLKGHETRLDTSCDYNAQNSSDGLQHSLPEIFIQIKDPLTGVRKVIQGVCVLARNPSLHRGDIRVVMACDIPSLHHMCDVVVMPQNGIRDLPSMCSGGDLDGDDYLVFWDKDLIPKVWNVEPFHYDPPPPKVVNGEITVNDMINFFYDYMQNDILGRIAHAHLAAADFLAEGLESEKCLDLVQLHSVAVDYPKTGVPAKMSRKLESTQWPHFMEKRGKTYHSKKILGQLYDSVGRAKFNPDYTLPFDTRILNAPQPSKEIFEQVQHLKREYDNDMQRIMAQHNIRTEFEIWSTFVLDHSKASRDYKFHEEIGQLSKALKDQYYAALCVLAGGKDFDSLAPLAVAAYKYSHYQYKLANKDDDQGPSESGLRNRPFISFPWILQDTLIQIAKAGTNQTSAKTIATIQNGSIVQQDSDLHIDEGGVATIELPFKISAVKHCGHMADPFELNAESADNNPGIEEHE